MPREKFKSRKPTKIVTPGVGSYEVGKSFTSAVEKGLAKMAIFTRDHSGSYITRLLKEKNKIPAVGSYKNSEKGLDRISRPSSSARRRI